MWHYIARRVLLFVPTLIGILLATFIIIQFVPGGPVEQLVQQLRGQQRGAEAAGATLYRGSVGMDPERLAELNKLYEFDKPAPQRFWEMLQRFARFDLGQSYHHHQSVAGLIVSKLPVSISLGWWTFMLTYSIALPLGMWKAVRDGSRFDFISSLLVLVGYALPGFLLGLALLVLFGGGSFWSWFPLGGLTSENAETWSWPARIADYFWHLCLPLLASVVGQFAVMTLLTKNGFLEEIRKQYVLTARAKGLSGAQILWRHVFRNAMLPILTGFPAAFIAAFFTGSLLIETTFSLDGLGLLSYESVMRRDYPVVMGSLYLFSLLGLFTKLLTDVCYVWADPRIQFEGGQA